MKFRDIPKMTKRPTSHYDFEWEYFINDWLHDLEFKYEELDLNPDYQRDHVWTEKQEISYIENMLRGFPTGRDIYFNHPGWHSDFKGKMEIVDGKQRIQAVTKFIKNAIPIFGGNYYNDFEDSLDFFDGKFSVYVNDLKNRRDVIKWYLEFNSGGTIHTDDELNRVRKLLEVELGK